MLAESRWLPCVPYSTDSSISTVSPQNSHVKMSRFSDLREDVQFLAVGTASGQFALRVESRCFPVFAHDLDFLTPLSDDRERKTGAGIAISSLLTQDAGIEWLK